MALFIIDYFDHDENSLKQKQVEADSKEQIQTPPQAIVYEQLSFEL